MPTNIHKREFTRENLVKQTTTVYSGKNMQGNKIINQYQMIKNIGEGGYGKVKLAFSNNKKFAIKIMNKHKLKQNQYFVQGKNGLMKIRNSLMEVQSEIAVMKKVRHPNLVRLYEVIDD